MDLFYAYLKLLVAFPIVIILLYFVLRYLLPRFAPALGMGRRLKVVERLALSNRTFLYVVSLDKQYLLLAATPNTVTLIKDLGEEWEDPLQELSETGKIPQEPLPFAGILNNIINRIKGREK